MSAFFKTPRKDNNTPTLNITWLDINFNQAKEKVICFNYMMFLLFPCSCLLRLDVSLDKTNKLCRNQNKRKTFFNRTLSTESNFGFDNDQ